MADELQNRLSIMLGKHFMPKDSDERAWVAGSDIFTREEVAQLLWTQIAMIGNDLKRECGNDLTHVMFAILDDPRIPNF